MHGHKAFTTGTRPIFFDLKINLKIGEINHGEPAHSWISQG
jgi:hypothetical protein